MKARQEPLQPADPARRGFPAPRQGRREPARFRCRRRNLRRLLGAVQYAMAQQDIRYYLNGLLLVVDGTELKLVATDGHRLAFARACAAGEHARGRRRSAAQDRDRALQAARRHATTRSASSSSPPGAFSFGYDRAGHQADRRQVSGLHARHPDHAQEPHAVEREPLRQALQRAAILSNEKFRGVRWVLADGSLKIISTNADQEEAQEELEVKYDGDALDIGFNVNYLLDVLNNVPGSGLSARSAMPTRARSSAMRAKRLQVRRDADEDLGRSRNTCPQRTTAEKRTSGRSDGRLRLRPASRS